MLVRRQWPWLSRSAFFRTDRSVKSVWIMALYLFDEICTINLEETSRIKRGRDLNLNHGYSLACRTDLATNLAINLNTMSEDYCVAFESSGGFTSILATLQVPIQFLNQWNVKIELNLTRIKSTHFFQILIFKLIPRQRVVLALATDSSINSRGNGGPAEDAIFSLWSDQAVADNAYFAWRSFVGLGRKYKRCATQVSWLFSGFRLDA